MEPPVEQMAPAPIEQAAPTPEATPAPPEPTVPAAPETFEQAVELCATHGEMVLYAHLMNDVALVRFAPGRVELTAGPRAPDNLAAQFGRLLSDWTGASWQVEIHHDAPAEPSLGAQRDVAERAHRDKAIAHPSVQAALDAFPGAKVEDVRSVPAMPMFDADLANPDNDPMNGEPTP